MRNIFIINAAQVVTSETNPQGVYSAVSGYPKTFDSRNYDATTENPNGDEEKALMAAKSDYYSQLSKFFSFNANRVMFAITLERADGRQILRESNGSFPDMTPEPEQNLQSEEPAE